MWKHQATIWKNGNPNGSFFATTFSRPFTDAEGQWRNGTSFGLNDLEALLTVARQAQAWMCSCREALNDFTESLGQIQGFLFVL